MTIGKEILEGIATILWASAWADHAEDHRCCNLSGCEITECMPEIPPVAYSVALAVVASIESANNTTVDELYARAIAANQTNPDNVGVDTATRFGECLAFMWQGAGVSWFDDNAAFPLEVPYGEDLDLRDYADSECKEKNTGRVRCAECGAYRDECEECDECTARSNATYVEPAAATADDDARDYGYDSEVN